ncbi:hypothetical protein [Sulfitobacter geojensis]|uniref:hypothetical protein n=1 Tax=Sulfitobacter geojensis TaxID=1342299 RepID=UPI002491B8D7|nr:hypothetical protein [Sulfitobacter geojensis]
MPFRLFALIFVSALIAAAVTVWLVSLGRPALLVAAIPAFLIAALAYRTLRR